MRSIHNTKREDVTVLAFQTWVLYPRCSPHPSAGYCVVSLSDLQYEDLPGKSLIKVYKDKVTQSRSYLERICQVDHREWPMRWGESPTWLLEPTTRRRDCCSRCQLRQSSGRSGAELEVGQGGSLHYSYACNGY